MRPHRRQQKTAPAGARAGTGKQVEIPLLKWAVGAIGAGIVIGHTMIAGLKLHNLILKHAPGLASLIPRDGLVLLGLVAGAAIVGLWL
jgi:hypothetical protein